MNAPNVYQMLPTSAARVEYNQYNQRANQAISVALNEGHATLLVRKIDNSLYSYIVTPPGTNANQAGFSFAQAVGATSKPVSEVPDLSGSHVARVVVRKSDTMERYAQAGVDWAELPNIIGYTLGNGDWFAATFRAPKRVEKSRWQRWFQVNAGVGATTHPSLDVNAVIVELCAGSVSDRQSAEHMLENICRSMPGVDIGFKARAVSPSRGLVLPALMIVAGIVGLVVNGRFGLSGLLFAGVALIVCGLALGLLRSRDLAVPNGRRFLLRVWSGVFSRPGKVSSFSVRAPRREQQLQDGRVRPAFLGDYPLNKHCILTAPNVFCSMVAPVSGAQSGAVQSSTRAIPPHLLGQVGPLVASGKGTDQVLHLDARHMHFGVAICGAAGSGKSAFLRGLCGFSMMEKSNPSGRAGFPGAQNTIIAIENKGPDGASYYLRWAEAMGSTMKLIELADPSTPAIDFLDSGASTVDGRARDFVDAMVYYWSEQSIGARARRVLTNTLTAGLVLEKHPQVVAMANDGLEPHETVIPERKSAVYLAWILCQGLGDNAAVRLAGALKSVSDTNDELRLAHQAIDSYFTGKKESYRSSEMPSSENKLDALVKMEQWFDPDRPKVPWKTILEKHRDVVLNLGTAVNGGVVSDSDTAVMSALAAFTLRQSVSRTCAGWADQNRWVSIFADELSLLAGQSSEVVEWFREKGRSFGVRVCFATQRPGQLSPSVRQSFMSMATLVAFRQNSPEVIGEIVSDLNLDGSNWTPQDVAQLPEYEAVFRTEGPTGRLPSFTGHILYFEDNMGEYWERQGYPRPARMGSTTAPVGHALPAGNSSQGFAPHASSPEQPVGIPGVFPSSSGIRSVPHDPPMSTESRSSNSGDARW